MSFATRAETEFDKLVREAGPLIYEKKNVRKGIVMLERAAQLNPQAWWTYSNIGNAYLWHLEEKGKEVENAQRAVQYTEKAIASGWTDGAAQLNFAKAKVLLAKGHVEFAQKKYDAALALYVQVLDIPMNEPWLYADAGYKLLYQAALPMQALPFLEKANGIKSDKNLAEALGRAYLHAGRLGDARHVLPAGSQLAREISPRRITMTGRVPAKKFIGWLAQNGAQKIRLSLPLIRPYQKFISAQFKDSTGAVLQYEDIRYHGSHFAEFDAAIAQSEFIEALIIVEQRPTQPLVAADLAPGTMADVEPALVAGFPAEKYSYYDNDKSFQRLAAGLTASVPSQSEKIMNGLGYLRSNFTWNSDRGKFQTLTASLQRKRGDCFAFTLIGLGFMKSLNVPAHFLYGISAANPNAKNGFENTHAIMEYYHKASGEWVPLEPQGGWFPGIINPHYVPFMAYRADVMTETQYSTEGIPEVDFTMLWFNAPNGAVSTRVEPL